MKKLIQMYLLLGAGSWELGGAGGVYSIPSKTRVGTQYAVLSLYSTVSTIREHNSTVQSKVEEVAVIATVVVARQYLSKPPSISLSNQLDTRNKI